MRLRHKAWAAPLIEEHRDIAFNLENIEKNDLPSFNRLEIGSGCGGFLIQMAQKYPEDTFLGVEVAGTAFAISIKKDVALEEKRPHNLYFLNAPVEKLFPLIKEESLDAIYLNFSDPWPKKRHHKRRLTYPTKLKEYSKLLKKGGSLYFKTDNIVLYTDSKKYYESVQDLYDIRFIDDYKVEDNPSDCMTEYEQKFRSKGVSIHRIEARKK